VTQGPLTVFALGGNSRKYISIYEVFLLEDQPTLNMIRRAEPDATVDSMNAGIEPRLAGDMVFLLKDQVIILWDFVSDKWARWYTHEDVSIVSRQRRFFPS